MGFFSPETWDIPAQLAEHWQKIALGVVAIGGAIGSVVKWGLAPVRWAASKARFRSPRERADLRFVSPMRQRIGAL